MHDRWVVALALATCAGAVAARPLALVLALAMLLAAARSRRPALLCIAAALVASCMAARAPGPDSTGRLRGACGAPRSSSPIRWSTTARCSRSRGSTGATSAWRCGSRCRVRRRSARHSRARRWPSRALRGRCERAERHLRARHVVGADRAWTRSGRSAAAIPQPCSPTGSGGRSWTGRRRCHRGTGHCSSGCSSATTEDSRPTSPMTSAPRVSVICSRSRGRTSRLLLTLAAPLLRRLRLDTRLAVTLGLVAFFALLTRFEPSVLRACTMATVTATATALGRHVSPVRALGLAVTALVLVDPLVVHLLGFQLSVAACFAIAVVAPRLAGALPGPRLARGRPRRHRGRADRRRAAPARDVRSGPARSPAGQPPRRPRRRARDGLGTSDGARRGPRRRHRRRGAARPDALASSGGSRRSRRAARGRASARSVLRACSSWRSPCWRSRCGTDSRGPLGAPWWRSPACSWSRRS